MSERSHRRLPVVVCVVLLAAGCVLMAWALTHQLRAPAAPSGSARVRQDLPSPTTPAPAAGVRGTSHARRHATPPATWGTQPAAPVPRPRKGLPRSLPIRVVIPSIGVDSPLLRLGLDSSGQIRVPQPPYYDFAAWYTGSPTPGQTGPAVIEGHVDGVGTTPSVFFRLGGLRKGDRITVTRRDGRAVTFTVYRARRYPKDAFPTGEVYGNTIVPELRLITCGGDLDRSSGHYEDNTVVYARMTRIYH